VVEGLTLWLRFKVRNLKLINLMEKTKFELWKLKMKDFLVQQGLEKALVGRSKKPTSMKNDECDDLDTTKLSIICLFLTDDVFFLI
jgi:hypothetical protein